MTLTLRIDNLSHLPDGGPLEYTVNQSGFEIGRDPGMDWTLPDPNRFISSCHNEIRFEQGAYLLYDVSTNGTFVNGSSMRVKSPYQLQLGDRLQLGHYVVIVAVLSTAAAPAPAPEKAAPASPFGGGVGGDIWSMGAAAAAPTGFDPTPRSKERLPDFGDQHIPTSGSFGGPFGAPAAPAAPPAPAAPAPRVDANSPFGAPAPSGGAGGGSPFGQTAPTPPLKPLAPEPEDEGESPFAPARPAAPPASGSPFDAPKPRDADSGSPFGAPEHTKPPAIPPAQVQVAPAPAPAHAAPVARALPQTHVPLSEPSASETFGAAPAASRPVPSPSAAPASGGAPADSAILRAICEGAGMKPDALNGADPLTVAHEIGQSLRIVAAELAGLLRARAAAKQMVKSGSRTMIGHDANNPMKFIPTAGEALEVMYGPGRPGYMRGSEAVQSSFNDVKKHQYAVHAAIQPALARLLEDLSPEAIEDKVEGSRFTSKGSKAWDLYVERWDAKTHPYENGMLDVFLAYFADAYDDANQG